MRIKSQKSKLDGVLILEPVIFTDNRGFFYESFNQLDFCSILDSDVRFLQDNHSLSSEGVVRGLHYQLNNPQGKLVRALKGKIFDVAVDLRAKSASFGQWVGFELSDENMRQVWIPPGFAHGFMSLSKSSEVLYKTTNYWFPEDEHCLLWDDPELGIDWPLHNNILVSQKDKEGKPFKACSYYE